MDFLPWLPDPDPESKSVAAATKPSVAGMYDVTLHGTNSAAADQDQEVVEVQNAMPDVFNENRSFIRRCVRYTSPTFFKTCFWRLFQH